MSTETIILLAVWGAICSVWFGLLVAQRRARRQGLFLEVASGTQAGAMQHDDAPSVCVVIAARNEAEGLEDCLGYVLRQDYPKLSVLVIDDRSEEDVPWPVGGLMAARCFIGYPVLRCRATPSLAAGLSR